MPGKGEWVGLEGGAEAGERGAGMSAVMFWTKQSLESIVGSKHCVNRFQDLKVRALRCVVLCETVCEACKCASVCVCVCVCVAASMQVRHRL